MSEAERSFQAAWAVVEALVTFGVRDACVSPGSRSTPIALALWRHPSVHVHVHLDERASAFFGLGMAKASGAPVAVATTSGTAVAELLPAVVEASMSRTTLVLLTADRPPEVRGVGANQTIDQPGIFGAYVRASLDAPVPRDVDDLDTWREDIRHAIFASTGPPPGPVHLNLPFREPLVPVEMVGVVASEWTDVRYSIPEDPPPEAFDALVEAFSEQRGLLLAGSLREVPSELARLADRVAWPLLAEPTSGWRRPGSLAAGSQLLGDAGWVDAHVPDVVVQVGAAPTSRAGLELVQRAGRLLIVDPDHLVADPHRRASLTVQADLAALIPDLARAVEPARDRSWWAEWQAADDAARRPVDDVVDASDEPFEGRIARDVASSLPDGSTLVVGSSMPVRDLDAYMAPREGVDVIANRGASGIDGFVSTALGVAAVGPGPTTALMGDLTFLYDVGSFLWSARRALDAVLVVVNNDGGGIFELLSQRDLPELEHLFVTPHGLDLGSICAAAGAGHTLVTRSSELVPAVDATRDAGGVRVVEVRVDRAHAARKRDEVRAAVAAALRSFA
jgi:2-succinyl-5-enolpyruvyl-6-hydroxy-3-cyclohexene-1-carboxylate synthase